MAKRKLKVRERMVSLAGEYESWAVNVRLNPPLRTYEKLGSGDITQVREGLAGIVRTLWNFVDESGEPLGIQPGEVPTDEEGKPAVTVLGSPKGMEPPNGMAGPWSVPTLEALGEIDLDLLEAMVDAYTEATTKLPEA